MLQQLALFYRPSVADLGGADPGAEDPGAAPQI